MKMRVYASGEPKVYYDTETKKYECFAFVLDGVEPIRLKFEDGNVES